MQAIDSGTLPDDAEVFNLDSDVIAGLILKDLNYNYDGVSDKLFWLYLNIIEYTWLTIINDTFYLNSLSIHIV